MGSLKHASYIMLGAWSFSIFLASLPLFGISDYRKEGIFGRDFLLKEEFHKILLFIIFCFIVHPQLTFKAIVQYCFVLCKNFKAEMPFFTKSFHRSLTIRQSFAEVTNHATLTFYTFLLCIFQSVHNFDPKILEQSLVTC